jgi:hypothetical protein
MSITFIRRAGIACFTFVLLMMPIACVGPQGPPGPPGPSGSRGGPPYVWICTPAQFPNAGTSTGSIYVFNGSSSTANVAVNFLGRDGNNLAGVTVPGSNPAATYPGEAGATTVPLPAAHTRRVPYVTPDTGGKGVTNVSFSVRVTSDQPIAVGADLCSVASIQRPVASCPSSGAV